MSVTTSPLVGREAELAALLAAVDAERSAVLTAPPGMGKTTIMRTFVAAVADRDVTMLTARPTEPESRMAFSGLTDLLSAVPEVEYDALPLPQRSALRAVLLLDEAVDETDPRAVAAGVRTVLRGLAERRPVLLVVDDAQWLDEATTTALTTVMRSLEDAPVSVVAAARPTGAQPAEWIAGTPDRLSLVPLTAPALFQVVRAHLGIALGRGRLLEIERVSGGNPLYALEFARHTGAGAEATFERLLGDRLRSLDREARLGLLVAALAGDAPLELVAAARECSPVEQLDRLDPAVRAGLVTVGGGVEFAHPLFARAVVETAARVDVEDAHRRLAAVAPSPEARARHLAQASTGADAELADQLADAADDVRRRGGWSSSIELLELAVERTPDRTGACERAIRLAGWLRTSNRFDEAERWLAMARDRSEDDRVWVATLDLCDLLGEQLRMEEVGVLLEQLAGATLPPALRARYLLDWWVAWPPDSPASVVLQRLHEANAEVASLPDDADLRKVRAGPLILEGHLREYLALGPADDLFARAAALVGPAGERWYHETDFTNALRHYRAARFDEARAGYECTLRRATDHGDEAARTACLSELAGTALAVGDWAEAEELAQLAWETSLGQGDEQQSRQGVTSATLAGLKGDLDSARSTFEAMIAADVAADDLHMVAVHRGFLASVLLAHGLAQEAYQQLRAARDAGDVAEAFDPGALPVDEELVVARLETGRAAEAIDHIAVVRVRAERMRRTATLRALDLFEAVAQGLEGDLAGAAERLPPLLEAYGDACREPMKLARAHVLAGRILRRAGQKRRSHESLNRAVEICESLPCPPYAEQARAELARVGLRPRASGELTDTERRVAELASEGLRNKEIAEQAFIAAKTVEAVLGRVYRKLGIRSRAELARALEALAD